LNTVLNDLEHLRQRVAELEAENDRLTKASRQSEELFRKIFHTSSNMMEIHTIREGRFVDVNEAAASFGGFKREELIGRTMEARNLLQDPAVNDLVVRKLQEEGKVGNIELKVRTNRGDIRTVLFSADPVTVNNEPCLLVVSVDITDREAEANALRQSEAALKESKEYLNQIINCIGDAIFVKDREHRFVLVNDAMCALTGKSRWEMLGQSEMPEAVAQSLRDQEEHVFETGKESLSEDALTDWEGTPRTVMTKKSILTDKNGNKLIVGVLRDITENKRLEAQFLQVQKMEAIGVLAGGVAHDFNNLLNVINGYTELILDDLEENDPLRKDVDLIREAGQRATILTSQLLAFGRKQILQLEVFDLNHVIDNMSSMLRRMIGEDVEIISNTQSTPAMINADPGKIQQVVMNLVVNARDAMPQGGKLTIETADVDFDESYVKEHPVTTPGLYVMLAISDNGIGMDAATQAHVFEPFFTTKEKGKGTGLGLSTVYGIVKQSGGFIWVYSEPGKGTTFKAYFPHAAGFNAVIHSDKRASLELRGSETVLIVEDEAAVRALASRVLNERGYHVLEAANGMDALRVAQDYAKEIHLVLTDVVMPGISGRVLVSRLEPDRPRIKALFISGYTENAIVNHSILDSDVAFLQKPFSVDGLVRKVREVLNT
jgi:two-component system cell cycle sensor histidine kinase/response regulator CckA